MTQDSQDWSHLSTSILSGVFQYLDLPDRYHAACACKNWLKVFNSEIVWQNFNFVFTGLTKDNRALKFATRFGMTLKRLFIAVDDIFDKTQCSIAQETFSIFLRYLAERGTCLSCFSLAVSSYTSTTFFSYDVIQTLEEFFKNQDKLICFQMSTNKIFTRPKIILRLIQKLSTNCAYTLEKLDLERIYLHFDRMYRLDGYIQSMAHWRQLRTVTLKYSFFNKEVLTVLTNGSGTKLMNLKLVIGEWDARDHTVTPSDWRTAKQLAPNLRVHLNIGVCGLSFQEFERLIPAEMPLQTFQSLEEVMGHSKSLTVNLLFSHLMEKFRNVLEKVNILGGFYVKRELNALLSKFIISLPKLQLLQLRCNFPPEMIDVLNLLTLDRNISLQVVNKR